MSKKEMRRYELVVTLKPTLPENIRLSTQKKIENLINNSGFNILNTDIWGKKYLAFMVKKHQEGYYIIYKIEENLEKLSQDNVEKFLKALSLLSEVIRYGIFSLKKYTMVQSQKNV